MARGRISSDHGPRIKERKANMARYWKQDELEKVKATLPTGKWNAQWMQNPTAEEGAILKREWWMTYTGEDIPQLHHVIQSYDTAFKKRRQLITLLLPHGEYSIHQRIVVLFNIVRCYQR